MKKFLLLTIISFLGVGLLYPQGSGTHPWVSLFDTIGGIATSSYDIDIVMDANDNAYVMGVFKDVNLQIGTETLIKRGDYDIFLCSFDQFGNFRWARSISSSGKDDRAGIIIDGSDIYIGGAYTGAELFFSHSVISLQPDDNFDSFIAHYSTDGTLQDAKRVFWGSNVQRLKDIELDKFNDYIVTIGIFKTHLVHGSSPGDTIDVLGTKDQFIARFDLSTGFSNLSLTDIKTYYSSAIQTVFKEIQNSIIGSSLTGYFVGGDLFGNIELTVTDILVGSSTLTADAMVIKLDDNLDYVWSRRGGAAGYDHVNSAVSDDDGNIYLAGKYSGSITWDSTATLQSASKPVFGGIDMYILKYNQDGRLLWSNFNGDTGDDNAYGLALDDEFVQTAGNLSHTGTTNTGFIKYDHNGNYVAQNEILGDGEDIGKGVAFDSEGNTYIGGYFNSDTLFFGNRTSPDTFLVNKTGTYDGFIGKYRYPISIIKTDQQEILCYGDNSGSISVTARFGISPYSWRLYYDNDWGTGMHDLGELANVTIDTLSAGTYTFVAEDQLGDTAFIEENLIDPVQLSIGRTLTHISCNGLNDGEIDITASGGSPSYTYFWIGGTGTETNDEDQTGIYAGDFTVTVTDSKGCELDSTFTLIQPTEVTIDSFQTGNVTIFGADDGWAKVFPSGGTPPYTTYDWSNGGSTDSIYGLAGGNYSVDVIDFNGCIGNGDTTISEPGLLIVTMSAIQATVTCFGDSDGSVRATASGGERPYSWEFSSGTIVADTIAANLAPGWVIVTVTDFFGAKGYDSLQIIQPGELVVSAANLQDVSCFGYSDGGFDLSVTGGTAPFTYLWSNGSTASNLTNISKGLYSVTVTDDHGCQDVVFGLINEADSIEMSFDVTDALCVGEANGAIDLTVDGGTADYTYLWSTTQTTEDIDLILAGKYWVDVTDANGCYNSDTTYVGELEELVATGVEYKQACFARTDGQTRALSTGGTSPFTYLWDDPSNQTDSIAIGLGPNRYYLVTVTDINGCQDTGRVYLNEQAAIVVNTDSTEDIACSDYTNGKIYVSHNGTGPFTYDWTPGNINTEDLMDVGPGIYELVLFDAFGCQNIPFEDTIKDLSVAINILTQESTDPTCSDGDDGKIVLEATGGNGTLNYSIDDKSSWKIHPDTEWNGLSAGSYITVVRDAMGCEIYGDTLMLVGQDAIVITVDYIDSVDCFGGATGGAAIIATGGTGTLAYSWDSGENSDTIRNKSAGKYIVTVTDDNLCTKQDSVEIKQPDEFILVSLTSDWDGQFGTINVSINGGTLPYTYSLIGVQDSTTNISMVTVDSLAGGDYHFTVVDGNDCGPLEDYVVALSVHNPLYDSEILLFPNPNTGEFTIEMENQNEGDINIEIINMTGQMVFKKYYPYDGAPKFVRTIDLGQQAKGTYFIRVNGLSVKAKLMIE